MPPPPITIVGLGPGDASLLTVEARDALVSAPEVWLRTARHPTVPGLPAGPRYEGFDAVYEREPSFAAVYETIVARVLELAARPEGVVYAVPGHPLFGEATVRALLERAPAGDVRVVPGISFLDVLVAPLRLDPLASGMLLLDALSLEDSHVLEPQRPTVIAQVYDQRAASAAKLTLLELYPPGHAVTLVHAAGTPDVAVESRSLEALDHNAGAFAHLTSIFVPPLAPVDDVRSFAGLRAVVARLRAPEGGCPWDLEQTHDTLKPFLIEEAYEAVDALDGGDPRGIAEELGDLMMQVLLHAQIAEDGGTFALEDVIGSITTKLIRRHPHVFGDLTVESADEVLRNWETLKKDERGDAPLLDAVPTAMPALAQAQSVLGRASKAGLAGDGTAAGEAFARANASLDASTLGELLLAIVELARTNGLDAEGSLRMAVRRFRDGVSQREATRNDASAASE